VRDGAACERDESMRAQVCVVGSGPGGATVACELARRGHSVILLEEGEFRTGRDFTGEPRAMAALLRRNGGLTEVDAGTLAIGVPLARCVGGSSVIGGGTSERVPDAVLDRWSADGVAALGARELRPYYARAEQELGVEPISETTFGRNAALLERGAAQLGHAGARVRRAARGCVATGVCEHGCPQDAQRGVHLTFVPQALAAGAMLYTRTRADRLLLSGGRAFGVQASFLGDDGLPTGRTLRVVADRVVVACGALLTPALLARSGVAAPAQLGRNLHLQPSARVSARFPDEVRGWAEVPEGFAVAQFLDEGIAIHSHFAQPAALALQVAAVGRTHAAILSRYAHLGSVLVRIADDGSGAVRATRDTFPAVDYRLAEGDRRRLLRGMSLAAEMLFAAGALEVYPALRRRPVLTSNEEAVALRDGTVSDDELQLGAHHPLGTARMADDAKQGVTSSFGEVHGVPDLYVVDASLLPSAPGTAPQTTIVALALRAAQHLSDDLGAPL
jgi:choline dehydrogenase-like flavoprotein